MEGGTISGNVAAAGASQGKSAAPGIPLPGVAITALNTLTGRKYTAATDVDGNFALKIPKNGRYVVRAELAAFANGAQEVVLNATNHEGKLSFTLTLASRVKPEDSTENGASSSISSAIANALNGKGLQSLGVSSGTDAQTENASVSEGNTGTSLPSLASMDSAGGGDSVAISGQMGQTNGLANFSEEEVRNRIEEAIRNARENGGTSMDGMNSAISTLGGMMAGGMPGGPGMGGGPGGGMSGGSRGGSRGSRGGSSGMGGFSISRGNFKGFNPGQIHGAFYYHVGNAVFDATQFSVTGTPFKPAYAVNHFGASLTGSPYIPGLTQPNPAQFVFLNFTGTRDALPVNITGNVPTVAQRAGDLRGLKPAYDPTTGQQFCNGAVGACPAGQANIIPTSRLDPVAQQLLAFFPLPNVNVNGYNLQRIANRGNNTSQIASRYVRNFGQNAGMPGGGFFGRTSRSQKPTLRQNINVGFNYQHNALDTLRLFAISDSHTFTDAFSLSAGYVVGYGRLNHSASFSWSRSHTLVTSPYTYNAQPGVINTLNLPRPATQGDFYNGFPTVSITNFNGINGVSPSDRHYQVFSYNDYMSWNHHKHSYRGGFSIRRQFSDLLGGSNSMGTLNFTGYATQLGTNDKTTGSGLADFLLGAPQNSVIQNAGYQSELRAWIWSAYLQDDWRARNNLTFNFGLRYEYFGPFVEAHDRLVNLAPSADFKGSTPVVPSAAAAAMSTSPVAVAGASGFPRSLVNPDRNNFSPRIGVAWTPIKFPIKQLVVRAGYGINYNTGQYTSFANNLSYQPQFAQATTHGLSVQQNTATQYGCGTFTSGYTITNAFGCTTGSSGTTIVNQNTYAIDKNYSLGRVQVVNFDLQKTWKLGIVTNVGYNGSFGANLDMQRVPNRTSAYTAPEGGLAYIYEDSIGDSRFHSLSVSARKRMSRGVSLGATYIYGHSIDNASAINGTGGNTIPQNDKRLDLEYGNSTFDVRHQVSGDWVTELPFGPDRLWLTKGGFWAALLDGFNLSGSFKFATGTYYTPQFSNTSSQIASGGGRYTQRPDRVAGQPINDGAGTGTIARWFNTAAFDTTNIASPLGYGNAQRNAIEGPGTVQVNMALARNQKIGNGTQNLEFRASASNVFNTVQYSGISVVVNSPYYGRVTSAAAPRKITLQLRYRF